MIMRNDWLADTLRSMGCNHGYFFGIITLESPVEAPDAVGRENRSWCCYELGYLVSWYIDDIKATLTSLKSRSHIYSPSQIYRATTNAGSIM